MDYSLHTPYELGNHNQTSSWQECIAFYQMLAYRFPHALHFEQIGTSDAGIPIHAGVVSSDSVFAREQIQREGRAIFFNNNGIHPGEPEGIDVCMALVRDFCTKPELRAKLGSTVFLFIPVYNVDGCNNRSNTSRVNQDGPELFGFRGNSRHLDLNRDFLKCDSLAAQCFNRFFAMWQPDVMVDTHTSNGADYPYTMTLIATQPDKLGGALGHFLRSSMLPAIYAAMEVRGWPTCPYVNPIEDTPEQGIADFLETPRFSTGYAALHHCIGFMPETHMLKPYADRYAAMRALLETVLDFTILNGGQIQMLRAQARKATPTHWPVSWKMDSDRPTPLLFKGYAAVYKPSLLGDYQRLAYDRNQAWQRKIKHFKHFQVEHQVATPQAYLVPQQWREVVQRLEMNGKKMKKITSAKTMQVQTYRISRVRSRRGPYEGHMFHDEFVLNTQFETVQLRVGDYWLALPQPNARYAIETLEPQGHDSFFRWGFFNSVLEKKEAYSNYVFEDHALELLEKEATLKGAFEVWKKANPDKLGNQEAVLDFIFANCERYAEKEWGRYPIFRII